MTDHERRWQMARKRGRRYWPNGSSLKNAIIYRKVPQLCVGGSICVQPVAVNRYVAPSKKLAETRSG